MSIVDHNQGVQVPYSIEDTFMALRQACQNLDGFNINDFDETLKILYLKAGVSLFSWGENITVTVASCDNGNSEISILSTPKTGVMFGGTVDMGKNRKNINTIMSALSEELKNYVQVTKNLLQQNQLQTKLENLQNLKNKGYLLKMNFQVRKTIIRIVENDKLQDQYKMILIFI